MTQSRSKSKAITIKPPEPPEELSTVWDDEIAEAFAALNPKQQTFLIHYITSANASESYRKAYNPLANGDVAASCGRQVLSSTHISAILSKFLEQRTQAMFLVQKTFQEAANNATKPIFGKDELGQPILVMDMPDHAVRVKAADSIAKLHGLNAPAEVKHSGEITSKVQLIELPRKQVND